MAFYCRNLEEKIFYNHKDMVKEPDELFIISGYLGPNEIFKLNELPFAKMTVIAGMYSKGVNHGLYDSIKKAQEQNSRLIVRFTNIEVHSKIYIWKRKGDIREVLMGSANFSNNGLKTDYRESLADISKNDINRLEDYCDFVLENSTDKPPIVEPKKNKLTVEQTFKMVRNPEEVEKLAQTSDTYELPLFSHKNGLNFVPEKSGLNWCLSNGHVAKGDAYIAIPKEIIKTRPNFFPKYDTNYKSPKGEKMRQSDPIELIWDDGVIMEASAEGTQRNNGDSFPKQLTSFSSKSRKELGGISAKSILGRYIRKRLGVSIDKLVTISDLKNYGRTTISISKISDGVYYLDFSV